MRRLPCAAFAAAALFPIGCVAARGGEPKVYACVPIEAGAASASAERLGIGKDLAGAFLKSVCRYAVSGRVSILSYDLNAVRLPAWPHPGADPRFPMPLILVDGKDAGRLPAHVPAELPVTTDIQARPGVLPGVPMLCLKAQTDAVGDPPVYPPLVWQRGAYRPQVDVRACR